MPSKSDKITKELISKEIMAVFSVPSNINKTFNYKQIAAILGLKDSSSRALIVSCMNELAEKSFLMQVDFGKFKLKASKAFVEGIIDITVSGVAFVTSPSFETDIFISEKNIKNALPGDKVKVFVHAKRREGRIEGEVSDIIERAKSEYVGTIQMSAKWAFLLPDNKKMQVDIFIPLEHLKGAKDGQKAVATIDEWPKQAKNPFGKVVRVLGWPGQHETEMDAILIEYGFATEFPKEVEAEAGKISTTITAEEIAKRRDFRKITTFTIDPVDAKDFDDALSLRTLPSGNFEVGVHIADVTHYIKPATILEEEASTRATSVYLVDRVIPMLPEKLSNELCSLRPQEEKLCFSAVFEIDANANLVNEWFGKTIIYSDRRFTYEQAQEIIEGAEGDYKEEILTLDRLAKKMRAERFRHGAIGFDKVEVKFHLDDKGFPTGVYVKESKDSNKLIEEFMLLANRKVAEFVGKAKAAQKPKTFVYRIHDTPSPDKLATFSGFVAKFGHKLNISNNSQLAHSLNALMANIKGKKEENVIEQLAIRTMAKAIYTTENKGHYGLGFSYYSHFTSPIRRYPDMMAHRLLEHYLAGGKSANAETYEALCKHSTDMEIQAAQAERDSVKFKQVQFLEKHVGEEFDGLISGVTDWGIYVELVDSHCEGMIRLRDLTDDFYEFDEDNYCIRGTRTKKIYQLGDSIRVRLKRADVIKKQIDFEMVKVVSHGSEMSFEEEFGFDPWGTQKKKPYQKPQHKRRR